MARARPVARARWTEPAELAACLAALCLSGRHLALAKRGFALTQVEAELSAAGRLTVRVVWERAMQRAGGGLLARARRHRRTVDTLAIDLPPGRDLYAAQQLQARAKLGKVTASGAANAPARAHFDAPPERAAGGAACR